MSERYPGGYITKSPPTPTFASAPGVWTLDQAMQYIKEGNWPTFGQGYLMGIGTGNAGSLDRNTNFSASPASTTNQETIYYGPWNGGSKTGGYHASGVCFLIKTDGTLWGVGFSPNGQLGINQLKVDAGSGSSSNAFVQVGTATDWLNAKIAVGGTGSTTDGFVIAVKSNGTLWSWGQNQNGMLGQNDVAPRSSPTQVGALTTWQDVAAGQNHWVATKTDGTIWACGDNGHGQLGQNNRTNRSSPVQIGALTDWGNAFLAAGENYCSVVKADGTLWSWGLNTSGRLGINVTGAATGTRSSPIQVGALTTWSKVFTTGLSTFGITNAGALWAWGDASNGALGTGNQTNRSSPVQIGALTNWSSVASRQSQYTAIAVKTDGTLWHWGALGGTFDPAVALSSPVQIGSDTDWSTIVNGYNTRYFDGKTSALYAAQLIFKTTKNRPYGSGVPQQAVYNNPLIEVNWPVLLTDDLWASVSTSGYSSFGIKRNGTLWAWGENAVGELAQGNTTLKSSPTQIGALTNWKDVVVSISSGNASSVFAINSNNELYAWGINTEGRLGLGNVQPRSSPVQVGALTNWKQISAGQATIAVKTDNTIWSWGSNSAGAMGTNSPTTTGRRSSPVQIGALTDWSSVYVGDTSCAAIKTDNTLWVWGNNSNGQLGQNNITNRSSPVQVGALTNWLNASISDTCLAVKTDGTLWAWGLNSNGQIGDGTAVSRSSPVQIGSNTNWKDVLSLSTVSYAITTTGQLYVWGFIATSTSGTETIYRSSPVQLGASSYYLSFNNQGYNNYRTAFLQTNATS